MSDCRTRRYAPTRGYGPAPSTFPLKQEEAAELLARPQCGVDQSPDRPSHSRGILELRRNEETRLFWRRFPDTDREIEQVVAAALARAAAELWRIGCTAPSGRFSIPL